jgi:hypothetical protein
MDVAHYMAQEYEWPPCWQLVTDIYRTELETGVQEFKTVNGSVRAIAEAFRLAIYKGEHGFRQTEDPQDYAVVLMAKLAGRTPHHCGIYYGGKVLHATQSGVIYQDLSTLADEFARIEYWVKECQ